MSEEQRDGGMAHAQYSDMTAEQMLAWGEAERQARIADLADRSPDGLARAQANAEARRKLIGASRSAAARMVSDASRAARWNSAQSPAASLRGATEGQ